MSSSHVYWHIYPQDQIKSELRGNLVLVLEVPWAAGSPVIRRIVDPTGLDFPCTGAFCGVLRTDHHGIMYVGVNKSAAYDLMLADPPMLLADTSYALYNRDIIRNARNFFLIDPNRGFKAMPQHMIQLL